VATVLPFARLPCAMLKTPATLLSCIVENLRAARVMTARAKEAVCPQP
jgi:hypothetical protein